MGGYFTSKKGVFVTPEQTTSLGNVTPNTYSYIKGRMFDFWIGVNSRSVGYIAGDLIENPAYVIESLLRDEVFVERDLRAGTIYSAASFLVPGLKSDVDDYYNEAYLHNVSTNESDKIIDYNGTTKNIILDNGITIYENDNIYITNIQGDARIDIDSFDAVGNTSTGLRDGWSLGLSLTDETSIKSILDEICHESFLLLSKTHEKYKLFAIDESGTTPDTWDSPLNKDGLPMIQIMPVSLDFLYNDFKINYGWHHGRSKYSNTMIINKSGYSSTSSNLTSGGLGTTLQGYCQDVYDNYRIDRKLEIDLPYIRESATARLFAEKAVMWRTKQRLAVIWSGDFKNYNQYEIGDTVILNHWLIPDSLRNSAQFIITGKEINMSDVPYINFSLLQVGY